MSSGRNEMTTITTSSATDERTSFEECDMRTPGLKRGMSQQGLCHATACDSGADDYKVCIFGEIAGLVRSYTLMWWFLP